MEFLYDSQALFIFGCGMETTILFLLSQTAKLLIILLSTNFN